MFLYSVRYIGLYILSPLPFQFYTILSSFLVSRPLHPMALNQELKAKTLFFFIKKQNRASCLPKTFSVQLHLIPQPLIFFFIKDSWTNDNQLNMYRNKHKHAEKQMKQRHLHDIFLKCILHTYILLMFISYHSSVLISFDTMLDAFEFKVGF